MPFIVFLVVTSIFSFSLGKERQATVTLSTVTTGHVSGRFLDATGLGIHFSSKENSVVISTLENQPLAEFGEPATLGTNGDEYRLVQLKGRHFLDIQTAKGRIGMDITSDEVNILRSGKDARGIMQQAALVSKHGNSTTVFPEAVNDLMADPHSKVIINAAKHLGEKEGLMGHENPAILPFYIFALRLNHLFEDNHSNTSLDNNHDGHEFFECLHPQCPPCPKKDCIGMCGPHCKCWKWLCGDCCYHLGCFKHDLCCLYHGKMSVQCLSIWRFHCNYYWCKD